MGMTCHVHAFAVRVGGEFRISLAYDAPTGVGKTTAHTDTYHGRFVEFVPNKRVVEIDEFETEDPTLGGEMKITIELVDKRLKIWWPGTELNRRRQPFRAVFFEPKPFFIQQLNPSRWQIYCDHS